MKKTLFAVIFLFSISIFSQEKGNFFGGFETNSQWYLNDKGINIVHPNIPLRSNDYLFLNYKINNWSAGIQAEAYEDQALLNFNPGYKNTNVATYFVQYQNKNIDLTAGYFYEQFGSGLLFRSWEDRALGINNALRGGRVIFSPLDFITFKGIYGQQRSGFNVSNAKIYGSDLDLSLSKILKIEKTELSLGITYVGRDEITEISNPNFSSLTNAFAGRLNFSHQSFYASTEYNYKSKDAVVQINNQIENDFIKPGSALLFNLGYSKKGFGIDGTFRRLENMSFYSERSAKGNTYNDKIMNFVPSLTKQHHYNLANIYVYQAQPNVYLSDESLVKAGEIGGQIDVFYDFKKGTKMGGKYGTKIAFNFSNWNALGGSFNIVYPKDYKTDFIGFGKKYFSDYNIEITKKWTQKWQSAFSYVNQYYNSKLIEGTYGLVKTNIIGAETTYKLNSNRSLRMVGEHLWADRDKKNWASATMEFNANSKISFYVSDMYNYGNNETEKRNHYYNIGGAYRKNSTRFALNYGRQRGGLLCVGGVCRFVPESSGISLSLNTTF
jgi:Family of unknown function (DUF6029)